MRQTLIVRGYDIVALHRSFDGPCHVADLAVILVFRPEADDPYVVARWRIGAPEWENGEYFAGYHRAVKAFAERAADLLPS